MRDSVRASRGVRLAVAATLLLVPVASAQRRTVDNTAEGEPVATNTIVQNAGAYYGKAVTISAGVEQVLSKTAFLVDQRRVVRGEGVKGMGAPILVIAPYLSRAVKAADVLVVRGEVVKFEPPELARVAPQYTVDLPLDAGAAYAGRPVLLATSVRDSMSVELAAKP